MVENRKTWVWIGWLIGGIPIIASSLRAISALTGTNWVAQIPIAADISEALQQVPVFQTSQNIAFSQVELVLTLFLLIFVGWVVLGILLTGNVRRRLEAANVIAGTAVGVVALSYIVLYIGVYNSLLVQEIPVVQLAIFYAFPVVSAAALFGSYRAYPWEDNRYKRAISRLSNAEETVQQKHETYNQMIKHEIGRQDVHTHNVEIEEDFEAEVNSVLESIRHFTQAGTASEVHSYDIERVERRADELTIKADSLDPERAASNVRSAFDSELERRIDADLASFSPTTPIGETIKIQNLPTRYSQISGPKGFTLELSTDQADIKNQIREAVASGQMSLVDALEFVEVARSHIESTVKPYMSAHAKLLAPCLNEWPSTEDEETRTIQEQLTIIRQRFDSIGGDTQIALKNLYVTGGQVEEVVSCADAEAAVEEARTAFIDGDFEAIEPNVEQAKGVVDALLTASDYFGNTLVRALSNNAESAPVLPPTATKQPVFTKTAYQSVIPALERDYNISLSLYWTEKTWEVGPPEEESSRAIETESTSTKSESKMNTTNKTNEFEEYVINDEVEDLKYSVRVLVETLREATREGGEVAKIDRAEMPPLINNEAVTQFRLFIDQHDQLVIKSEPEASEIRVKPTEDVTLNTAGRKLLDDYSTWTAQPDNLKTTTE